MLCQRNSVVGIDCYGIRFKMEVIVVIRIRNYVYWGNVSRTTALLITSMPISMAVVIVNIITFKCTINRYAVRSDENEMSLSIRMYMRDIHIYIN